jgi:hypothetical protein
MTSSAAPILPQANPFRSTFHPSHKFRVPHPSRTCEGWETTNASPVLALAFALAFLAVIPEGNLLLSLLPGRARLAGVGLRLPIYHCHSTARELHQRGASTASSVFHTSKSKSESATQNSSSCWPQKRQALASLRPQTSLGFWAGADRPPIPDSSHPQGFD